MSTKIYCDIADINLIKKFNKKLVKGFTTNPSLMRKAGAKNYEKYSKEILQVCKKPISFEVFSDDYKSMRREALIINSWGKTVYVKIPVTNSKGKFMGKLIKELSQLNIKLNITAVYNSYQTKKIFTMFEKKFNSDHFDFRRKGSRCRKRSYTRVEKKFKNVKKI